MNDEIIDIFVYPTSVKFNVIDGYKLKNGLWLNDFTKSLTLFEFDYKSNKWFATHRYAIWDEVTEMASIPRYYLKYLVDYIKYNGGNVNIVHAHTPEGKPIYFKTNHNFWMPRDYQEPIIEYLSSEDDKTMKTLPLATGKGKTSIALFSIVKVGETALIIVEGLIDQWYEVMVDGRAGKPSFFDMDEMSEKAFVVIKGQNSIIDLLDTLESNPMYQPSIILGSLSTMRNYIAADKLPYSEFPSFQTLSEKLGIGVKIVDEAHRCFSTIVDIDLKSNIKRNWYLSATFTRGDRQSKRIFKKVFPDTIQYQASDKEGHIRTYYLSYNLGYFNKWSISTKHGYSQNKYENAILNDMYKKIEFLSFINNCVAAYYINEKKEGQKCLVMANTRNMCEAIQTYLKEIYSELRVNLYLGESEESVLDNSDIIVSTEKKSGTGTDILNLKTMINTLSIGSEVLVTQIPGRLRPLKDDIPIYVAMYNRGLDEHVRHYKYCKEFYKKNSKEFIDINDFST